MFYVLFVIGAIIYTYGYIKNKKANNDFRMYYQQASDNDKVFKLVNYTLEEEKLKEEINDLQKEVERLRSLLKTKRQPISFQELIQRLQGPDAEQTIEELSKEMEIGKGELQLLKNLFQR